MRFHAAIQKCDTSLSKYCLCAKRPTSLSMLKKRSIHTLENTHYILYYDVYTDYIPHLFCSPPTPTLTFACDRTREHQPNTTTITLNKTSPCLFLGGLPGIYQLNFQKSLSSHYIPLLSCSNHRKNWGFKCPVTPLGFIQVASLPNMPPARASKVAKVSGSRLSCHWTGSIWQLLFPKLIGLCILVVIVWGQL